MSVWPIIVRELRAQARQPLTHWLRVVGGVSVLAAFAAAAWSLRELPPEIRGGEGFRNTVRAFGMALFGKMNLFIFGAIWLFVPLATADALSRERREGTLPLLYLTKLRSVGIVVGKALVHVLRSLSLFLAMAPWLLLPLVFGGIGLNDITMALMLDSASVLLAQAAGLVASSIPKDWLKSAILALGFALVLLLLMLHVHGAILSKTLVLGTPPPLTPGGPGFWQSGLADVWQVIESNRSPGVLSRIQNLLTLITNDSLPESRRWYGGVFGRSGLESNWGELWTGLLPAGRLYWFRGVAAMVVGAALILFGAIWLAAWRIEHSWRDTPKEILTPELRHTFLTPRFRAQGLKRRLSRALTANPIGWLQHYSPSARMVKWGWCLFLIVLEILLSTSESDLYAAQAGLGLLLLLGLAFSATASFRNELETGAFELLLVTPLRERQIIVGRARGLWRQFLPAMLVYGTGSVYLASGWSDHDIASEAWLGLARTVTGFCTVPLVGLFFSLQRWNFFTAWLVACLIALLPAALARGLGATDKSIIPAQIALGVAAAVLLEIRLKRRKFVQKKWSGQ